MERLKKAGWEPVEGDFNAGKASWYDNNDLAKDNVAAVMGIRRTNDKKGGVRLYWKADEGAFVSNAASTFGTGQLALAGIGGLIIGILGSSLVLLPRRRKEKTAENKAETTA